MGERMQSAILENPLREGLRMEQVAPPCAMVIFGASGDLTRRKLVPALYTLAVEGLLPPGFTVVGYARRQMSTDDFRAQLRDSVNEFARLRPIDPQVWAAFEQSIFYLSAAFENPE